MKKSMAMAILFFTLVSASPLMPTAHAATIEDTVVQALAQNPNAAKVQDVLKLKKELSNNQVNWGGVAQAVLQKSGNQNMMNLLAGGNAGQVVQNALRQEVEKRVVEELGSYQKPIEMVAALFGMNPDLSPKAVKDNDSLTGAPKNYKRVLDMKATAYAPGVLDNGKWNDKTYMGGLVQKGVVAVDPNVIPMGSKLWVEGYGEAMAVDQGSAIKGNRIDLAFNTRSEALDYGIKNIKVYQLN